MSRVQRPPVRRKPWRPRVWTTPATPGPDAYVKVEAELREMVTLLAVAVPTFGPLDLTGQAGTYELTLPSGRVVTILAQTDADDRAAAAILPTP